MKKIYTFIAASMLYSQIFSQVTVTTLAGTGVSGYLDGNSGVAMFKNPEGIAVDNAGNVYVSDSGNYRLRKIATDGTVSTFSGDGTKGFADGSASAAKFDGLGDMVIDSFGNIYLVDFYNHRIRKITSTGDVSTFAGTGVSGFADGIAANAQFKNPAGLAIDAADNIYVADQNNNRIRKISGGQVTTIAGDGSNGYLDSNALASKFDYPTDIAVVGQDIYVVDNWNNKIRKISGGQVSTVAGSSYGFADGSLATAKFYNPLMIVASASGDLIITDAVNRRIRKISGGQVSTLAGSGVNGFADGDAASAKFALPSGIAIGNDGSLYIVDGPNNRIRKISIANEFLSVNEFLKNKEMVLYPNPAKNDFTIKSQENETLVLLDASGRKIKSIELKANQNQNVNVSSLPKGVYILTDGKTKSAKVIKE